MAFYAGSLEGFYGSEGNNPGKLLHELADKRCKNFGTCKSNGASAVNDAVVGLFRKGQFKLLSGKCVEAIDIKSRIVDFMSVPLVQGSLRYAYKVDKLGGGSKEKAEGAAFSAAILPRIATCDSSAAQIISMNMNIDSLTPMTSGFTVVKQAFESTYACLGITCENVGGLILEGKEYYESAEPCTDSLPMKEVKVEVLVPAPAEETGLPVWVFL